MCWLQVSLHTGGWLGWLEFLIRHEAGFKWKCSYNNPIFLLYNYVCTCLNTGWIVQFLSLQILNKIGNIDFKDIVCDPAELTKYLILNPKVNKFAVSTELCRLDDTLVSNITNELMRQLDIANILRVVSKCRQVN